MQVRLMVAEDVDAAAAVAARSFELELRDDADRTRWAQRVGYLLATDAAGCFVALEADSIVGVGQARLVAEISRAVRGGSHSAEVAFALSRGAELLLYEQRAFAVAQPGYGVWALAGLDERAATLVLTQALRIGADSEETMRWLTAGQDWAIRTALAAGLRLSASGALCVRGAPGPLQPYVPSAPFA